MQGTDVLIYLAVFVILAALDSAANPYPPIRNRYELALVTRQLRAVTRGSFQKQRLLNISEDRIFQIIEKDIRGARKGFRVFPQVNLGEILQSPNRAAFFAINSKRVDILIVDDARLPVAAVEFQGSGHFQGTAEARDAIKSEALRKAGIAYVEIFENESAEEICSRVREHLGWEPAPAELKPVRVPEPEQHFGRARTARAIGT